MKGLWILGLMVALFLLVGIAGAEDKPTDSSPTIFVPYDNLERVIKAPRPKIYLSLEEYRKLLRDARALEKRPVGIAVVSEALYKGTVSGNVARLDARLKFRSVGVQPARLKLPLSGISVSKIVSADDGMIVGPVTGGIEIITVKAGVYNLHLELVGHVRKKAARATLAIKVPPAAVSRLDLTLPETGISPVITPEVGFFVRESEKSTQIIATLGDARDIVLSWRPRVEKITELPPAMFFSSNTRVYVEETLVKAEIIADIRIAHAPVSEFSFKVPVGYSVVNVSAEGMKEWTVADGKLQVTLFAPVANAYRLNVELQRVRSRDEAEMKLPALQLPEARQEQGHFAIAYPKTLSARLVTGEGMAEIETKDLPAALKANARIAARYLQRDFSATLKVAPLKPQLRANTILYQDVREDKVFYRALVRLDVRQAGILRSLLYLPPDAREVIVRGKLVSDFNIRDEEKQRAVMVEFSRKILGETAMEIQFETPAPVSETNAAPIGIEGARHHEGWIGLRIADVFRPALTRMHALRSVDSKEALKHIRSAFPNVKSVNMAFRYVEAPYAVTVALKRKKASVNAVVNTLAVVKRDHINVTGYIDYTIRYAAVDNLRISLPKSLARSAVIEGIGIKEKRLLEKEESETRAVWEIVLQRPMRGSYRLTVKLELPLKWTGKAELISALPELGAEGVERESGFIAVSRDPSLAVRPEHIENLEPVDFRELPVRLKQENVFLAYRFFRRPHKCDIRVEKGKPALIVGTLINYEVLVASLAADGSYTIDVKWELQNNARQEIAVDLPKSAKILMVSVAGKQLTPRRRPRDGKLVVPVPRTNGRGKITVHMAYMIEKGANVVTPPVPEDVKVLGSYWRVHVHPGRIALWFKTPLRFANRWQLDPFNPLAQAKPISRLGKTVFAGGGQNISRAGGIRVHLDPNSRAYSFVGPGGSKPLEVIGVSLLWWRLLSFAVALGVVSLAIRMPKIAQKCLTVAAILCLIVLGVVAKALVASLGWALLGSIVAFAPFIQSRLRHLFSRPPKPEVHLEVGGGEDA